MLQEIYNFFVTFFTLENVTPETQAFLDLTIIVASVGMAIALIFFIYKLIKAIFLMLIRG